MLHGSAAELGKDNAAKRKAKLGVKLFFIYAFIYAGFVFIGVARPEWMGVRVVYGLNLAIVYGFSLIIIAVVMGFLYHLACSRLENELNKEEGTL
ncbi:MAG: DUF485 domain-containing protein [Bacteroidales bacterium]